MPSPAVAAPVNMPPAMAGAANAAAAASSASNSGDASASAAINGPIGADFAALLLAQMGTAVEMVASGDIAANTESADLTEETTDPTANANDMSALFAALAFTQTQPTTPAAPILAKEAGNGPLTAPELKIGEGTGSAKGADPLAAQAEGGVPSPVIGGSAAENSGSDFGNKPGGKAANIAAFDTTLKQIEAKTDISAPVLPDAPPAVHAAHQAHGSANTTSSVTQARVDTPVRDPAFGQEFSQKIVWLAGQDKQSAQLTLNPPQLGPVEVSLKISGDQATAVFSSPHAEVREAIEAALPRLREMMGSAGLELGQANVSSQSFQQQQQEQAAQNQAGASRGGSTGGILAEGGNEPAATTGTVIRQSNGLVDTFA